MVKKKMTNVDSLVLMASMYYEYRFLHCTFVERHQCLFGVKAELYNTVKANVDEYEGAWLIWNGAFKKYYNKMDAFSKAQVRLLDWGELLYGEVRYSSDKERKEYGIKPYKKFF